MHLFDNVVVFFQAGGGERSNKHDERPSGSNSSSSGTGSGSSAGGSSGTSGSSGGSYSSVPRKSFDLVALMADKRKELSLREEAACVAAAAAAHAAAAAAIMQVRKTHLQTKYQY